MVRCTRPRRSEASPEARARGPDRAIRGVRGPDPPRIPLRSEALVPESPDATAEGAPRIGRSVSHRPFPGALREPCAAQPDGGAGTAGVRPGPVTAVTAEGRAGPWPPSRRREGTRPRGGRRVALLLMAALATADAAAQPILRTDHQIDGEPGITLFVREVRAPRARSSGRGIDGRMPVGSGSDGPGSHAGWTPTTGASSCPAEAVGPGLLVRAPGR